MTSLGNVKLIDDIRKDALILMKSRPDLDYLEAFKLASENLIGDTKVTEFEAKPFTYTSDLEGYDNVEQPEVAEKEEVMFESNDNYYKDVATKELSHILNIDDYNNDQLKAYVIAHRMGVDISKFASELYSPEQVNFLAVMISSGADISDYLNNYNFNPVEEFSKIADFVADFKLEEKGITGE